MPKLSACDLIASQCPEVLIEKARDDEDKLIELAKRAINEATEVNSYSCKVAIFRLLAIADKVPKIKPLFSEIVLAWKDECSLALREIEERTCSTIDAFLLSGKDTTTLINSLLQIIKAQTEEGLVAAKVLLEWGVAYRSFVNQLLGGCMPASLGSLYSEVNEVRSKLIQEVLRKFEISELSNLVYGIEQRVVERVVEGKELVSELEGAAIRRSLGEVIDRLKELENLVKELRKLSEPASESLRVAVNEAFVKGIPMERDERTSCVPYFDVLTYEKLFELQMKKVLMEEHKLAGEKFGGTLEELSAEVGGLRIKGAYSIKSSFLRKRRNLLASVFAYHTNALSEGKECLCFSTGDLRSLLSTLPNADKVAVVALTLTEPCEKLKELVERGYSVENVGFVVFNPLSGAMAFSQNELGRELALFAPKFFGKPALIKATVDKVCKELGPGTRVTRDLLANLFNVSGEAAQRLMEELAKELKREMRGGFVINEEDCLRYASRNSQP